MKTAAQAAANWANSAGRAAQAWQEGVNNYSGDWAGATVAQEQTLLTNVTRSITNGDWRAGVLAKGTGGWKKATVDKAGNFATGFSAGAPRQAASAAKIQNALAGIVPGLPARGSFEQNKIRATTLMDAMHALRGQLGAR